MLESKEETEGVADTCFPRPNVAGMTEQNVSIGIRPIPKREGKPAAARKSPFRLSWPRYLVGAFDPALVD
jgi:hypothetical protein